MSLDDAIRRVAEEAARSDAAAKVRQQEEDAAARAAAPRLLQLLRDGRDRLRAAGVQPVHIIASRRQTLFHPARYALHAAVWEVSRAAISLDDRIFKVGHRKSTVRDRRDARDRGLPVGDAYFVLGEHRIVGDSNAEEITLRDCFPSTGRSSGWFHVEQDGAITVHRFRDNDDEITPLEEVIARQVAAATRC